MRYSDALSDILRLYDVSDAFGIPGGVILELLYAFKRSNIIAHLLYHEQDAIYAACGYSSTTNKLGVAYSTRGPGIMNMVTGIAEAYAESIPIIIVTAHQNKYFNKVKRFEYDQELRVKSIVSPITKAVIEIENEKDFIQSVKYACELACDGRKGPVVIDILSNLLSMVCYEEVCVDIDCNVSKVSIDTTKEVYNLIIESKRPVILIGDGIKRSDAEKELIELSNKLKVPIISSRGSQSIGIRANNYYGYVGSHGIRCANMILYKSDLVLVLGNRLAFPKSSSSFSVFYKKTIIRVDVDESELENSNGNVRNYNTDLKPFLKSFLNIGFFENDMFYEWRKACEHIHKSLLNYEQLTGGECAISYVLKSFKDIITVCDVGNHEFWISNVVNHINFKGEVIYSKSFGTLGASLGKAIGAYYANRKPIMVFIGDQGIQMCIQELQFIVNNSLPIVVVIVNNDSSGMIKSRQKRLYGDYIHTTLDTGFSHPNFEKIAYAYGINFIKYNNDRDVILKNNVLGPLIIEIDVDTEEDIKTNLPVGNEMYDLEPKIENDVIQELLSI